MRLFLGLIALGLTIYGLVLAFSASIILGLVVLLIEPLPFVIGLLAVLGYSGICEKIVQCFN